MLLDHWNKWKKLQEAEPAIFKTSIPDGTHPNEEASKTVTSPLSRTPLKAGADAA